MLWSLALAHADEGAAKPAPPDLSYGLGVAVRLNMGTNLGGGVGAQAFLGPVDVSLTWSGALLMDADGGTASQLAFEAGAHVPIVEGLQLEVLAATGQRHYFGIGGAYFDEDLGKTPYVGGSIGVAAPRSAPGVNVSFHPAVYIESDLVRRQQVVTWSETGWSCPVLFFDCPGFVSESFSEVVTVGRLDIGLRITMRLAVQGGASR